MTTPCAEADRGEQCDYGYGSDGAAPTSTAPATRRPTAPAPTRGNGGYGGEAPTTRRRRRDPPPASTPSRRAARARPTAPSTAADHPAAASAPAAPCRSPVRRWALTIALGALLVAGGAGAVWYTRRRRTA